MSVDRFDISVCGVCACNSQGAGYLPRHLIGKLNAKPMWLCDDPECLRIAKDTYAMRQDEFDRIEKLATMQAGHKLEQFCEGIGKSDFASFTQEEFETAMREVVGEYRHAMKVTLSNEPPF